MKPLLLSTAYFPPIAYFCAIKQYGSVYIEQYENFGKQSYRNRCEIMTANGVIPLTVPVAKANSKTCIKDLKIVYQTNWQKLHYKGIESAYKNSPYYEYYIDDLIPFFRAERNIFVRSEPISFGAPAFFPASQDSYATYRRLYRRRRYFLYRFP